MICQKMFLQCLLLSFSSLLWVAHCLAVSPPIVQTCSGKVQGFTALNGTVNVFYGIPYAQAPDKPSLRFEKPRPVKPWDGIRQAVDLPSTCYPHATPDWLNTFLGQGNLSEDCLRLNIFSPNGANYLTKLPVLVLIHGGGFEMGSSLEFANFTDIGANFVRHGIVVVSIQYRLGQLGFASTGDSVLPGNLGLWDQVAALQFIQDNIASFGGNPRQVTLLGQSAGSASVSALGLSPHSRDLFQRAIQVSGSAFSSWVRGSRVADETLKLARVLGCPTNNSAALKRCLQAKEPAEMLQAVTEMGASRAEPNPILFSARLDGHFFPKDPVELVANAPPKPTLIGLNKLEWLLTLLLGQNSSLSEQMLPASAVGSYGAADLLGYIQTQVATGQRFGAANGAVVQEIFNFYANSSAGEEQPAGSSAFYIYQYTQLISDLLITLPTVLEIEQKSLLDWPIYLYIDNYVNEAGFPPGFPINESYHINDLNYVFFNPTVNFAFNQQDLKIQAFMREAFRNFVKTGNPSTSSVSTPLQWPRVRSGLGSRLMMRHVQIEAPAPTVRTNTSALIERLQFWEKLTLKHPQYNVLREISPRDAQ